MIHPSNLVISAKGVKSSSHLWMVNFLRSFHHLLVKSSLSIKSPNKITIFHLWMVHFPIFPPLLWMKSPKIGLVDEALQAPNSSAAPLARGGRCGPRHPGRKMGSWPSKMWDFHQEKWGCSPRKMGMSPSKNQELVAKTQEFHHWKLNFWVV